MQFENGWCFIADVKSSKRKGARSFFNMLVAFAGAAMYVKAIFESVNTWRKVVVKQSWNADGMLWVVYKTFIFNSPNIIRHWRKADLGLVISSCNYGFVVWRVNVDCHIFLSWLLYSNVLSQKIQQNIGVQVIISKRLYESRHLNSLQRKIFKCPVVIKLLGNYEFLIYHQQKCFIMIKLR